MRWLLRWLGRALVLMLVLVVGYVGWASWAWRDIPVSTLESRYGGPDLARASIDGVTIRYRLQGQAPGSAPVLVLIHNHFLDMGMWDAWVAELSADFTLLRYDLAGHGLTGPDPGGIYTVARDVELLAGLLTHLQLEQVGLVGSSLGGNIAFSFAARHPERTRALVLVNSGGLKRSNSRSGRQMPDWADAVFPLVPPVALKRFLRWMAADKSAVTPELESRFVDLFRREGNRAAELARLRQYETGDPAPLVAAIRAPTLILWGEDNPQLPASLAQRFAEALSSAPQVTLRLYPGAGHLLPLERPLASARETRAFLLEAVAR